MVEPRPCGKMSDRGIFRFAVFDLMLFNQFWPIAEFDVLQIIMTIINNCKLCRPLSDLEFFNWNMYAYFDIYISYCKNGHNSGLSALKYKHHFRPIRNAAYGVAVSEPLTHYRSNVDFTHEGRYDQAGISELSYGWRNEVTISRDTQGLPSSAMTSDREKTSCSSRD